MEASDKCMVIWALWYFILGEFSHHVRSMKLQSLRDDTHMHTASTSLLTKHTKGHVWKIELMPITQKSTLESLLALMLTCITVKTTDNCSLGMQYTQEKHSADKNESGGHILRFRAHT